MHDAAASWCAAVRVIDGPRERCADLDSSGTYCLKTSSSSSSSSLLLLLTTHKLKMKATKRGKAEQKHSHSRLFGQQRSHGLMTSFFFL